MSKIKISYDNRDKKILFTFDGYDQLSAKIINYPYEKYLNGKVIEKKDMIIELENIHSIMRGNQQQVFYLNNLNRQQILGILKTINMRSIDVGYSLYGGYNLNLIIHALP